jgi:hypothetical protein
MSGYAKPFRCSIHRIRFRLRCFGLTVECVERCRRAVSVFAFALLGPSLLVNAHLLKLVVNGRNQYYTDYE